MSQNKAFSTPFFLAVICIYLSYFLHGISVITLAQNMTSLAAKFSTDSAGIAYLISGIGLGRLVSILFLASCRINSVVGRSFCWAPRYIFSFSSASLPVPT